jgi:hypothetical protein
MSTNYYVRTPETAPGDEGVHLGQLAAGTFTFRAHPERGVTYYEAWLAQLDKGVIYTESGYEVSREEMVKTAAAMRRVPSWVERGSAFRGGFYDGMGRRWLTVEFC